MLKKRDLAHIKKRDKFDILRAIVWFMWLETAKGRYVEVDEW